MRPLNNVKPDCNLPVYLTRLQAIIDRHMHVTGYSDKDCVLDCTNVVWIEQCYSSVISCRFNFLFNKKKELLSGMK